MYQMQINRLTEKDRTDVNSQVLLDKEQGCSGYCMAGITVYHNDTYAKEQVHDFQEGFYVITGNGYTLVDGVEYAIQEGDSFLVPEGILHTTRSDVNGAELKVFWFHSA